MIVTLTRWGRFDGGVFSLLRFGGFDLVATELAERAIPVGVYELIRDTTGRHQHWVIVGPRVGLAGSGEDWEQVEFHSGNWPTIDSRACILPGTSIMPMAPPERTAKLMAVTESKAALAIMHRVLGDERHGLVVRESGA